MDEAVRIYNPTKRFDDMRISKDSFTQVKVGTQEAYKPEKTVLSERKIESKLGFFCDWNLWKNLFEDGDKKRRELNAKYPWVPIMHNWLIVFLILALFGSFIAWGVNIHTERTAIAYAEVVAAEKDAEHQAFLAQQEADRKAAEESLENLMKTNAQVKAKLGYGSRNFIDKYHYGDSDIMTLYQCLDNRMKNSMYAGMTIDEIAFQEGQFIASYDTNPVQDYYFNLAMKSERLKNDRVSDPVGTDYVYTIYTEHGLYLANDPKAPAYTWWHYAE